MPATISNGKRQGLFRWNGRFMGQGRSCGGLNSGMPTVDKSYFRYWGKAGSGSGEPNVHHLLVYHCLDVAAVGSALLRLDGSLCDRLERLTRLPRTVLSQLLVFFLALHDVGKFSIRFQALRGDILRKLQGVSCALTYSTRHDDLGMALWTMTLRRECPFVAELAGNSGWSWFLDPWAAAFLGHHGEPKYIAHNDAHNAIRMDAVAGNAALEFARDVAELFLSPGEEWIRCDPDSGDAQDAQKRASWLLAGVAVLADWIGSDSRHFEYCPTPMPLAEYWERYAVPRADRALAASGVLSARPNREERFDEILPHLRGRAPSPAQRAVADLGRGADGQRLVLIEDLTGSGKTEAALLCVHGLMTRGLAQGLYVALPTMATANAMYDRLADAYGRLFAPGESPSLALAHAGRQLSEVFRASIGLEDQARPDASQEDGGPFCAAWLADNRKKALLASVGVGTIDQALLAVLPSRHQSLRLLGLGRGVLVVDEVHAYDTYMHTLLRRLLEFQAAQGGSAVLLSATLPSRTRRELVQAYCDGLGSSAPTLDKSSFPLVTAIGPGFVLEEPLPVRPGTERRVEVEFLHSPDAAVERIAAAAQAGACVAWVRNTVRDAMEAYDLLRARLEPEHVQLFHARFAQCDRLDKERDILARFGPESGAEARRGRVVVATQVAEQSLDLDWDLVVSDLAPLENLIQRAGRGCRHLWRTGRPDGFGDPRLLVLAPSLDGAPGADWYATLSPGAAHVYLRHAPLWLAAQWLKQHGGFRLPEDARAMLEHVYGSGAEENAPEALLLADQKRADPRMFAASSLASMNALRLDAGYSRDDQAWRDDERTPTRLGDESTRLRLCRWDGAALRPWADDPDLWRAWALSEVNVSAHRVAKATEADGALKMALDAARDALPDKGEWCLLIPLTRGEGGIWHGQARDGSGNVVSVRYDAERGLEVLA